MAKGPRPRPAVERVLARIVVTETGCWEFQGARRKYGYGVVGLNDGRTRDCHLVVYEHFVGPVPDGLELDHTCVNPPCCNWQHMEAVTHAVNIQRGYALIPKVTHCPRGHPYDESNTRVTRRGGRICRECHRVLSLESYHRRKALA